MATVKYTIEMPHGAYPGEVDIDDAELEGLSPADRERYIRDVVDQAVLNTVRGWEES